MVLKQNIGGAQKSECSLSRLLNLASSSGELPRAIIASSTYHASGRSRSVIAIEVESRASCYDI